MFSGKMLKIMYSILLTKCFVVIVLMLTGCGTEFFQPDPEDDIRTKPVEQVDEDYLSKPAKTLPLAWEDFKDRSIWSIVEKKVISYDGNQRYSVIDGSYIAYINDVPRGIVGAQNYEEIYIFDLDSSYNERIVYTETEKVQDLLYGKDKIKLLRLK